MSYTWYLSPLLHLRHIDKFLVKPRASTYITLRTLLSLRIPSWSIPFGWRELGNSRVDIARTDWSAYAWLCIRFPLYSSPLRFFILDSSRNDFSSSSWAFVSCCSMSPSRRSCCFRSSSGISVTVIRQEEVDIQQYDGCEGKPLTAKVFSTQSADTWRFRWAQ